MIDFIREFKFGRPQQFAALLLVAFLGLCTLRPFNVSDPDLWIYHQHGNYKIWLPTPKCVIEPDKKVIEPCYSSDDFVLRQRISAPAGKVGFWLQDRFSPQYRGDLSRLIWVNAALRIPFLLFGLSLAGAIWWVSRRLYDNAGAYVALSLFCFSWWTILWTSSLYAEIIAAWGLYGMIYAAIGVAHTLYAPPPKWRPRIALLGLAFGFTLCAHFIAFGVGLLLCTGFMLYLAPGRRASSLAIIAIACTIAFVMLLALYGFNPNSVFSELRGWQAWGFRFSASQWQWESVGFQDQDIWLGELAGLAVATFLVWKRTRYFGNAVPLIVTMCLFFLRSNGYTTMPWIWSLPFLFTFIGGICADLFESREFGSAWRVSIAIILLAYAVSGIVALRPAMG